MTITLFTYADIIDLAKKEPEKKLRLHWEGGEVEAKEVTPSYILSDIEEGEYTT